MRTIPGPRASWRICAATSQRDLAVPLLTEAAVNGVAVDIRSANTAAVVWCAEVNAAMHTEIQAIPTNG